MARADKNSITEYLLGRLNEPDEEQVELRLLTDPEFAEEYDFAVNEIIDDYISGKFSEPERKQVEEYFFKSPQRRNKLKFALALKQRKSEMVTIKGHKERSYKPYLAIAATILLIVGGFSIWRSLPSRNEVDKGLAALQSAFRDERPLEARISGFNYARYVSTRGPGDEKFDRDELALAELTLRLELKRNETPAAHHAFGKVFLAKKDFDGAIKEFDKALQGDPNNAQLYGDLGAAWLEKGKFDLGGKEPGKGTEELGRSLENLNKAMELNPNLLEARFNRALCRQTLMIPKAAEDWRDYLTRDSSSGWAEEARRNLKRLEEEKQKKAQTGEQLLQDFRSAYISRNDVAAWAALRPSRARTGNGIVQRLIDDYLSLTTGQRSSDASNELHALEYAAEVELERTGDRYTADLSRVYGNVDLTELRNLTEARRLLKTGIDLYNKAEWKEAIAYFSQARDLFSHANDPPESLFAEAWIGYSYLRIPDRKKSGETFQRLSTTFGPKGYKSLFAQSLLAEADALGPNKFSKVVGQVKKALVVSEEIQDSANAVRCLGAGTSMQLILGNYRDSLASAFRALTLMESLPPDPKLTWPFYHEASLDFFFLGMPTVALEFENEALRLALSADLPFHISRSYDRLALLLEGQRDYAEALNNIEQARAAGQRILDQKTRANVTAHSALNLGRLLRKSGNPRQAVESIDKALLFYQDPDLEIYKYPAHKEKLLALMALNETEAAEAELSTVLFWFEKFRKEIAEESYRNKFFEIGQSTYEIAVDFQISTRGDGRKAFDYAETARARSLLDLVTTGSLITGEPNNPELKISAETEPLDLSEIQRRLPNETQLLEYAVLDEKVIIWIVTKGQLNYAQVAISRDDLNQKIRNYLGILTSTGPKNPDELISLAKELYEKLIAPVESYLNPALQLCIVPDDNLNFLPFGLLMSPTSGQYLLQGYALQTSASATLFIANSEQASKKATEVAETALVVGDPKFDREKFSQLENLPAARHEATEVANLYGAAPLLGDAAVAASVRTALQRVNVAHFATHAVPDEQSPLLSKLLLAADRGDENPTPHSSAGFIQASEIYAMRLPHTRLVVLSACETGIERAYRGEGAIGLARPFIVAGVPMVVATLWPVESEASADFMISFHKHRKQDRVSTVEALHRAQLEALQKSQSSAQPNYDWAAFIAIGGYANF